jgi:hypothetical protein
MAQQGIATQQILGSWAAARDLIDVGTVALGRTFGDPATARAFANAANTALQAAFTLAVFPGAASPLSCVASLASLGTALSGLFGGAGSDPLSDALRSFDQRLVAIAERIETLIEMQADLLERFQRLEQTIAANQAEIRSALSDLLATQDKRWESAARDSRKGSFDTLKAAVKKWHDSNSGLSETWDLRHTAERFAKDEASKGYFSATANPAQSDAAFSWQQRKRVDLVIGLLPTYCQILQVDYDKHAPFASSFAPTTLANPVAWAMGVDRFLQASRRLQHEPSDNSPEQVPDSVLALWNVGLAVREAVLIATSPKTLRNASDQYWDACTKVIEALKARVGKRLASLASEGPIVVTRADKHVFRPRAPYQYVVGPRPTCPDGLFAFYCKNNSSKAAYEVSEDPIEYALKVGYIRKEHRGAARNSTGEAHGDSYYLVELRGARGGNRLSIDGKTVVLLEYGGRDGTQRAITYERLMFEGDEPNYQFIDFEEFVPALERVRALIRETEFEDRRRLAGQYVEEELSKLDGTGQPVREFCNTASAAHAVAAAALWRRSGTPASPPTLDGWFEFEWLPIARAENAPLISSRSDLNNLLQQHIARLGWEGGSEDLVDRALAPFEELRKTGCDAIDRAGQDQDALRSLDLVDSGLALLSAYNVSRGFPALELPYTDPVLA